MLGSTEILTEIDGFKYIKDLREDEKIAVLDSDDKLKFQNQPGLIKYQYKGDLIHLKERGKLDIKIDPNKYIYIRRKWRTYYEFMKAKDIINFDHYQYISCKAISNGWDGKNDQYYYLPKLKRDMSKQHCPKTLPDGNFKIKMRDWVKFMAWYLSEGSSGAYKNKKGTPKYTISIAQSPKSKYYDEVFKTISNIPFFHSTQMKNYVRIRNKELVLYLDQFGKSGSKFIPDYIKNLNSEYLEDFLITYAKGDGFFENNEIKNITTISPKMINDLQEICLKIGRYSSISKGTFGYYINISNKKESPIDPKQSKTISYSGDLFSIVTKYPFLIRNNGLCSFVKNNV